MSSMGSMGGFGSTSGPIAAGPASGSSVQKGYGSEELS